MGNVPPGEYVIEVTACAGNNGCAPSCGDWVQAILVVLATPKIWLSVWGPWGANLQVFGSGFSVNDEGCTLSVDGLAGVGPAYTLAGGGCQVQGGQLTGWIAISALPPGSYKLVADGLPVGDVASTDFSTGG